MSSSIDERIVSMKFNNSQFLTGIAATLNALANLKKGLNLDSAKKGVDNLNSSMSKLPPSQFGAGVQGLSGKFVALAAVGVTALANITNAAIATGAQLVKSLTIDPIKSGLEEYETNLNAIQTIMANTGLEGDKGLGKVNAALQKLNTYSDQTIYNFSEMARNIGTFTAAGVDLDTSTAAIKGISNLAAISGSNAQQASTAMYQLSQALAAGKVTLQDWNSVVNAGMGGKVFQNALKETARVHGVAVDSIIKEQGSFRESLQKGWVTSKILTETLSKFTGDLTDAQLKSMGYNAEQIAGIRKMGQTAQDAATKVKTMSQLIGTLQEAAGSGWSKTWAIVFGDFNEARTLFTNVNNVLGKMIGASANARNKVIGDWEKFGGRTAAIEGIKNAFYGIIQILKPIRNAFRDIFPAVTGKQLANLTKSFRDFTEAIKIGAVDAENLRRTFRGVFAIFSIAGSLFRGLLTVVGKLFGAFSEGSSGLLDFTGGIGDFLVRLDEAIKKSEGFTDFFDKLGTILASPIRLLFALGDAIREAFGALDKGGANALDGALAKIGARLEPFGAMADFISRTWSHMGDVLAGIMKLMTPFATAVGEAFGGLGEAISKSVSDGDFTTILDTINTGLFAALVVGIRKFLSGGKLIDTGGGDFLDSIKEAFGGLNDTLGAMQANLKSGTLIKIAGAIALLTASVVALSLIDSGKLTKALLALTAMFVQLGGAMAAFDAISSTKSVLKLGPMAAGLILLSTAILILSGAVKVLSTMSWEELAKGLSALVVLLAAVAGSVKLMSGAGKGLITTGLGMAALAVGINILAGAIAILATISWEGLARGLSGLAVALGIIAGAMRLMQGAIPGAAAMLIVSPALVVLAGALKLLSTLSWEEFAVSMSALAGGLLIIAGALYLMEAALPGAAAMLVVAPALIFMANALKIMATMSWEDFGKSMAILASSLGILAVTLTLMIAALPGAAALIVAAGALAILAPILLLFGNMSWEEIGKGLTTLAGALAIIGLAGAVLTPVIPTLLGLGAAVALLGVGMLAAGAGVLAFSVGLTALSVAGAASVASIIAIVSGLIGLIPMAMNAVAEGIVLMANVIGNSGPQFIRAMTTLMTSLLVSINNVAPKIINTIWTLVIAIANRVADGYPKLVSAGLRMITGILNGIAANIGGVVTAATNIVVNFINALAANLPRITNAGANMIITLVNSLAATINSRAGEMQAAGRNLAFAIVDGMTGGLLSGGSNVISAAVNMASNALDAAKNALGIHSPSREFYKVGKFARIGFAKGLTGGHDAIRAAVNTMRSSLSELIKGTGDDIKELESRLKELRKEPKKYAKAIARAESDLARARSENLRARSARDTLTKDLDDEERHLHRIASWYDKITKKLNTAKQELADARRTRDDYNRSIQDQYSDLGQIEGNSFKGFSTSLRTQLDQTRKFMSTLQKLRKLGLNDAMYEELLRKGPDAYPLALDILNQGKSGVKEINSLSGQLALASKTLGKTASKELYQAGVDAAAGLVSGLTKQRDRIEKLMERVANSMVSAIKRKLGIKSPSREFAKVGLFAVEGLVVGFKRSSNKYKKAAEDVGKESLEALRKSMSGAGDSVLSEIDARPIIRPVLDLSLVRKTVKDMPSLVTPIQLQASKAAALGISRITTPGFRDDNQTLTPSVTNVSFVQNNTSPKALSEVEIYRQTRNQISTVRGALKS